MDEIDTCCDSRRHARLLRDCGLLGKAKIAIQYARELIEPLGLPDRYRNRLDTLGPSRRRSGKLRVEDAGRASPAETAAFSAWLRPLLPVAVVTGRIQSSQREHAGDVAGFEAADVTGYPLLHLLEKGRRYGDGNIGRWIRLDGKRHLDQ